MKIPTTVISIVGRLYGPDIILRFQDAAEEAINAGRNVILDFSAVTTLDGEALGTLLNLPKRAAYHHCDLCLYWRSAQNRESFAPQSAPGRPV